MIYKYQMGGVGFTPPTFQDYSTKAEQPTQVAKQESSKTKSQPFVTAEDLRELAGKGLANDVTAFADKINASYNAYMAMSDNEKASPVGKQLAASLSGDLSELNNLQRMKEHYKESLDAAKEHKAATALATTGDNFIVKKDGRVGVVPFSKYYKDRETGKVDYSVLTVHDLAMEREFNPTLTNDTNLFSVIRQTKGIQYVADEINNILKNATGKNAEKSISERLLTSTEAQALEQLVGTLKGGTYSSYEEIENSSNSEQLNIALSTLTKNLDSQSIQTIKAQLIANGSNPEDLTSDFNNYLLTLVSPRLDNKTSKTSKLKIEDKQTKAGGSGSGGTENFGQYEIAATLRGRIEPISQMSKGPGILQGFGGELPEEANRGKDGNPAPIFDTPLAKVGNVDEAFTYDGEKVEPTRTIVTGKSYVTELPVKKNDKGVWQIDKDNIDTVAKFKAEIRKQELDKPLEKMSPLERVKYNTLVAEYGIGRNFELKKMIVANAVGYNRGDNNDFKWPWINKANNPLYEDPTQDQMHMLKKYVPEDDLAFRGIFDANAWQFQVFIPAGSQSDFRALDNNQLKVNKELVNEESYTAQKAAR